MQLCSVFDMNSHDHVWILLVKYSPSCKMALPRSSYQTGFDQLCGRKVMCRSSLRYRTFKCLHLLFFFFLNISIAQLKHLCAISSASCAIPIQLAYILDFDTSPNRSYLLNSKNYSVSLIYILATPFRNKKPKPRMQLTLEMCTKKWSSPASP